MRNTEMINSVKYLAFMGLLSGGVLSFVNCVPDEPGPGTPNIRQADELAIAQQMQNDAVCSGGELVCRARVRTNPSHAIVSFATPSGFTPADLASAYALNPRLRPTDTVAIVDAFDYPNAESDLAAYRSQFGLPACTRANGCFKIVNQNGAASPLPGIQPPGDDWNLEAALDLDMVSAACPSCNIVLVEAQDDRGDGLFVSQNAAAALPGVVAISNSWGQDSDGTEVAKDSMFFNHPNTSIFVASGDNGYTGSTPDYPSTSAHVTAVGGTSLVKSTTSARGWVESVWNNGAGSAGSSCSRQIGKPSFQPDTGCAGRAAADVSAIADPFTGVAVFDAADGGWVQMGGTSAASPFVAGVYARYGLGGQGPEYSYANAGRFFDVTTGNNGGCGTVLCSAGAGWDGPTGNGAPNGALLHSRLSEGASGKIAAVSRDPSTMEVFWVGSDGSVQDSYWYESTGWHHFQLAPPGSASASGRLTAVSRGSNTMEVFWIGPDGSVQDSYWYLASGWSHLEIAPAGSASVGGGVTSISRRPDTMEVWWTGADGSIQDAFWYETGGWGRFQLAPASSASNVAIIGATSRRQDAMEIWWVAPNGSVQDAYWYDSAGWAGFQLAPPSSASTTAGVSAVSRTPDTMELWWVGQNGSIQDAYWYVTSGWGAFELEPAGSASTTATIGAVSRRPDTMELWWAASNGSVQDAYWYLASGWATFQLEPAFSASTSAGIGVVSRRPDAMELWWGASNGTTQDAYWYEASGWATFQLAL